ncbi:hypothetical protein BGZ47_000676, partial [Haplosporangium gracile]
MDRGPCRLSQARIPTSIDGTFSGEGAAMTTTAHDQYELGEVFYKDGDDEERKEYEIWREFEFVHAPVLKSFYLIGPWRTDVRVLGALFGRLVPEVEDMAMLHCYGYSAAEWVK